MKNKFTQDEQAVIDFLKSRPRSTANEIAAFTGLRSRGTIARLLEDLDKKGVLRHTDDAIERYYLIHIRT